MELFECHGHLMLDGTEYARARARHGGGADRTALAENLAALRAAGVRAYRDGGDPLGVGLLGRDMAEEYGIRAASPVFAIYKRGRYGSILGRSYEDLSEYRALLSKVRRQGGDFIKLVVSGIITFREYGELSCPGLPAGEIRELIRIAHGEGFSVMCHANGPEQVLAVAAAGGESVEHGYFSDDDCLSAMAETGCVWVPTLTAVEAFLARPDTDRTVAEATLTRQQDAVRRAARMGVKLACGSDAGAAGVPHGAGAARERELLLSLIGEEALQTGNRRILEAFFR